MRIRDRHCCFKAGYLLGVALLPPMAVEAAAVPTVHYDLPAQPLTDALRAVARLSGARVMFSPDAVAGLSAPPLSGDLDPEQAVARLIAGTGLVLEQSDGTILIRGRFQAADPQTSGAPSPAGDIVVTGSRLRGAPVASPVITLSRETIVDSGYADLGSAMRAVPENFAGGQNPGVGPGAAAGGITNQNITGGSAVNLRGLGPDATLTLFNGHRLSYSGFAQAVDISSIPLAAIDRVEIVPDGASALYGSDAVAGVVNVILRPDFEGITTSARLGTATDGGDFQQQYNIVAGTHWRGGGGFVAYNYEHDTSLQARDRSYTEFLGEPYDLIPGQTSHSAVASIHQDIGAIATIKLDALYNSRVSPRTIAAYGEVLGTRSANRSFAASPELDLHLIDKWKLAINGNYSRERDRSHEQDLLDSAVVFDSRECYCNSLAGAEVNAEGPLFDLPAGAVRVAVGGGYRSAHFVEKSLTSGTRYEDGTQRDAYAYGEMSVPLVSPAMAFRFVRALSLTGAFRYENYNRFGDIVTPKFGLIYSPSRDLDVKLSWGRSFKAPTLLQQSQARTAYLLPASGFVGSTAPANATVLYLGGGSEDLKPERSRSWTATVSAHPTAISGLTVDVTYFNIHYSQRVLSPIGVYINAFDPDYSAYVRYHPDAADQQRAISQAPQGLQNEAGAAYDPSAVFALVNNYYTNVARQEIEGVDISSHYRLPAGPDAILLSLEGSWLRSRQQNIAALPYFDLAGTVWNPPHLRVRGGAGWDGRLVKAFAYLNYLGGVENTQLMPATHGSSMTTIDLSFRYLPDGGSLVFRGLELALSVQNLTNRRPPYLRPAPYVEPYDSTNYSAIGRFVQFTVSRHF